MGWGGVGGGGVAGCGVEAGLMVGWWGCGGWGVWLEVGLRLGLESEGGDWE